MLLWKTPYNLFISSLDRLNDPRPRNPPHQRVSVDLDNSYTMEFIAGLKDTGIAAVAGPSKQFSHATQHANCLPRVPLLMLVDSQACLREAP